jgi:flagellar biosynthetic protein FliP
MAQRGNVQQSPVQVPSVGREPEVVRLPAQPVLPETLERLSKGDLKRGESWLEGVEQWVGPKGISQSVQTLLLLTLLSAAPAAILMTTCYVRVVIVLGVLKQALGNQHLPPTQVLSGISIFITLFVMSPVWKQVYDESIVPYTSESSTMSAAAAWERGVAPVHRFMARQIAMAGNYDDVHLFYSRYAPNTTPPESFESVPLIVLLPAYMLSELKTAFLMGFQIYLPFLVLDLVIATVIASMGMSQLSPAMFSVPFKLLLFVLVDGWRLVVQMLLDSFGTLGASL